MSIDFETSDLGPSWGVLITYTTPSEKDATVESLNSQLESFRYRSPGNLTEFEPAIGVVNGIDISGQDNIFLGDSDAGKQVMGWVKSHKVILFCKTWEWELIQSRTPRWTSHLQSVRNVSSLPSIRNSVENLIDTGDISNQTNRYVVHQYLRHRSLFNEYLDNHGFDPNVIQKLIDRKGLWSLNKSELDLLLRPASELLRYIAAQELRHQYGGRFPRAEFAELFGEIPRQINLHSEDQLFQDILSGITPDGEEIDKLSKIQTLAGVLRGENFQVLLEEELNELFASDPSTLSELLRNIKSVDGFLERAEFIVEQIESESLRSKYSTLTTLLLVVNHGSGEHLDKVLDGYLGDVNQTDKRSISRQITYEIENNGWEQPRNHVKIKEFLQGPSPKIVLLLDGLPLATNSMREFLSGKMNDDRWTISWAFAPAPSITKKFVAMLNDNFDISDLGGFHDGDNQLKSVDFDIFLGEEREDELFELLQDDESIILYNNEVDHGAHYLTDIERKIDAHLESNIPEFIAKYGGLADILITSDHGMVEAYEENAITRPSAAGQKGLQHCRATFTDSIDDVKSDLATSSVSYIEVDLPETHETTIMVNPNNPHAKFGDQNTDLWLHGGISLEESLVPYLIRRRD